MTLRTKKMEKITNRLEIEKEQLLSDLKDSLPLNKCF
jgi:hypothetical protein